MPIAVRMLQDRFLKGMQSFGGFYREHLVDTDLIFKGSLIRWGLGLLGGLLLLAGLILNVSAKALPGVENSHLHSFRPFFAQQKPSSGSIHPAARMSGFQKPANIANPTAYGDPHGVFCTRCHGVAWDQKSSISLQPAARQAATALGLECASCHTQALAENSCLALDKIAQVSGSSTKSKTLSVSPC